MSKHDLNPLAEPAWKWLAQLRKDAAAYPDWSPSLVEGVTAHLRGPEGKSIRDAILSAMGLLGTPLEQLLPDDFVDEWRGFYGFDEHPNDPLLHLFHMSVPHQDPIPEGRAKLQRVAVGTLPQLMTVDPLTDERMRSRVAGAFVLAGQGGTYLISMTTQMQKLVSDFAVLISSTGPQGDFKIAPLELLDGLAALVRLRWINGETPPTWKMKYMPEQLFADSEWYLRNLLTSHTIALFLLNHELGHVALGHCDEAETGTQYIGETPVEMLIKARAAETEADRYAARVLARIAAEIPAMNGRRTQLLTYALLQLCKFLRFMDILADYSASAETHPPGEERYRSVVAEVLDAGVDVDASAISTTMMFSTGFFAGVRRRLE